MKTKTAILIVLLAIVALVAGCGRQAANEPAKNAPAKQSEGGPAPVEKNGQRGNFTIIEKHLTAADIAACKQVIEKHFVALRTHDVELYDSTRYNPAGVKTKPDDFQILRIKKAKIYQISEELNWFNLEKMQKGESGISRLSGKTWYKVAILNVDQLLVRAYENSKEVWQDKSNIDYILVKEKPDSPWVIIDSGR